MLAKHQVSEPNFISQFHAFIPIISSFFTGNPETVIAISRSLSIDKDFIVLFNNADPECVCIEMFLEMLNERISRELLIKKELISLKDRIADEYSKLCDGITNKESIFFIRNCRQQVIDSLFNCLKVDEKFIAESFYNDIANGFDTNAMNRFEELCFAVLWKPLFISPSIGLMISINEYLKKLGNEKNEQQLKEVTEKIISHMKDTLKPIKINDSQFSSEKELIELLQKIAEDKNVCEIQSENAIKYQETIKKYQFQCILNVELTVRTEIFSKENLNLYYDSLVLQGSLENIDPNVVFRKIPKYLKKLHLYLKIHRTFDWETMKECLSKLKFLEYLRINSGEYIVGSQGAEAISDALVNLKKLNVLKLLLYECDIGDNGAMMITNAIKRFSNIQRLHINFYDNGLSLIGIKELALALQEFRNLSFIHMNLGKNAMNNEGVQIIALSIKKMKNLLIFKLWLPDSQINDDGGIAIANALIDLKNITKLVLNLSINKLEDPGIAIILNSIEHLNLNHLDLKFRQNYLTTTSARNIAIFLQKFPSLKNLTLYLTQNNISIDGVLELLAALKKLNALDTLILYLVGCCTGLKGLPLIEELKNSNPKFKIYV